MYRLKPPNRPTDITPAEIPDNTYKVFSRMKQSLYEKYTLFDRIVDFFTWLKGRAK